MAEDVSGGDFEGIHESCSVIGELLDRIWPLRSVCESRAPVIHQDCLKFFTQFADHSFVPKMQLARKPCEENEGKPVPVDFIIHFNVVDLNFWHCIVPQ